MIQGIIAAAAALVLASAARAQEVPVRFMPEPSFEQIVVRAIEPIQARDAFAGLEECAVVDARTFAPVPMPQAQALLAPCLKAVARRYGQPVRLERVTAAPEGSMTIQVEGLAIYVSEEVPVTAPLMRDLSRSLSTRQGRILGHPVAIRRDVPASDNKPVLRPEAMTRSALQQTIDSCIQTQVVRRITTSEEFIASYGRCIVNDEKLRVREIRSAGRPLGVMVQSGADEPTVRSLNGLVRVFGGEGPVLVSVVAFGDAVSLR